MRLGQKLTLAFLAVGLAGVALVALLASRTTERQFRQFVFDQYQAGLIDQLADYYLTHQGWANVEGVFPVPELIPIPRALPNPRSEGFVTLVDRQGVVLLAGRSYQAGDQIRPEDLQGGMPIEAEGEVVGWLIAAREQFRDSPDEAAFLMRIQSTLTIGAIGAAVISLLLGILLTRAITRPIRELTSATRAVAAGDLNHKVSVRSGDELGELATSFNRMSTELARSLDLRRQMTADIAHELRTPISVILGHVDAAEEGVLPASSETFSIIRDEAIRLERLVQDLQTLSRADAGELPLMPRLIHPKLLLEQVIGAHRPFAHRKRITLQARIDPDTPEIEVDPERLAQVLDNLLSNAMRYTPEEGQVTLSAAGVEAGVEIRVQDSGPGIEPTELTRIFDRFYRTDKSRHREGGGSGLGLSVSRSIVEAHGGRIWAESRPGEGTTVVVRLPVPRPPEP